ncbi:MAG TPA: YetF domain-containing protein [Candidatus Dormibacteraeota bacterium]|nr:YetF domain-containing protein [Candidatus Dormibacteraeota bacterium]
MDSKMWTDMFVLTIPFWEKVLRSVAVYIFLIAGLRLAGKRELAQMNPFDLVVLLTLSNTVQNAIIGNDNTVTGGIIGASALLLVNYLVVRFLYKHERIERVLGGERAVLIDAGELQRDVLSKEMITSPELEAAAHKQGFASLDEIEQCVLEPGGGLSFVSKHPSPREEKYDALLRKLDQIMEELRNVRRMQAPPTT